MDILSFWKKMRSQKNSRTLIEDLARRCGTNQAYLSQIAYGHRRPSPQMALRIEKETGGQVRREELLPEIYAAPTPIVPEERDDSEA
jgi:DNA-binding transcriptional regulator YdaS (Cro superfamily)